MENEKMSKNQMHFYNFWENTLLQVLDFHYHYCYIHIQFILFCILGVIRLQMTALFLKYVS